MTSQTAITILKNLEQSLDDYCELNDEGKEVFRMAVDALERRKWIPCSERLPSDSDYYLVTDAYGDMSAIWFAHEKDYYGESEWRETEDEILAWMPLPEPYKEEGGEDE